MCFAQTKANEEKEKDKVKEEDEFPLTLAEIVERRQLMAKVRAQQSYRQAKAARQSKIKSKKYVVTCIMLPMTMTSNICFEVKCLNVVSLI